MLSVDLQDDVPRHQPVVRRPRRGRLRLPGQRRARASRSSRRRDPARAPVAAADPDALRPRRPRDRAEPDGGDAARRRRERVQTLSFGLGVSMAAAAGAVYGVIYPFNPGSHYDLISRLLSIVVLGGLGSLGGAVVAALAMGVDRGGRRGRDLADLVGVLLLRRPDRLPARPAAGDLRRRGSGRCEPRDRRRARARRLRSPRSRSPSRSSFTQPGS